MSTKIKIDVVSDVVCHWCIVGCDTKKTIETTPLLEASKISNPPS